MYLHLDTNERLLCLIVVVVFFFCFFLYNHSYGWKDYVGIKLVFPIFFLISQNIYIKSAEGRNPKYIRSIQRRA